MSVYYKKFDMLDNERKLRTKLRDRLKKYISTLYANTVHEGFGERVKHIINNIVLTDVLFTDYRLNIKKINDIEHYFFCLDLCYRDYTISYVLHTIEPNTIFVIKRIPFGTSIDKSVIEFTEFSEKFHYILDSFDIEYSENLVIFGQE